MSSRKGRVALPSEGLERLDADYAVNRFAELFPAAQQDRVGAAGWDVAEQPLGVRVLLLLNVRPTTLTSYFSIARRIAEPHPQPMSSRVIPG